MFSASKISWAEKMSRLPTYIEEAVIDFKRQGAHRPGTNCVSSRRFHSVLGQTCRNPGLGPRDTEVDLAGPVCSGCSSLGAGCWEEEVYGPLWGRAGDGLGRNL